VQALNWDLFKYRIIRNDVWWQFIGNNMTAIQKLNARHGNAFTTDYSNMYQPTDYLTAVQSIEQ
jgi:hypothetical protein